MQILVNLSIYIIKLLLNILFKDIMHKNLRYINYHYLSSIYHLFRFNILSLKLILFCKQVKLIIVCRSSITFRGVNDSQDSFFLFMMSCFYAVQFLCFLQQVVSIPMFQSPNKLLSSFLIRSDHKKTYQTAIEKASSQYFLSPFRVHHLTPAKILQTYKILHSKYYSTEGTSVPDAWHQNQLSLFIWILIVYAHMHSKHLRQINEQDYRFLSVILNGKNPDMLEFQALCLVKRNKSIKWTQEETQMLTIVMEYVFKYLSQQIEKRRWSYIAKEMFIRSKKRYFRTPKQCRERWMNHIDPSKIKSKWTISQDYELMNGVSKHGKKWSKIVKELNNKRTEHMIKNRFNSMINYESKKYEEEIDEEFLISKIRQRLESSSIIKQHHKRKSEQEAVKSPPQGPNNPFVKKAEQYSCMLPNVKTEMNLEVCGQSERSNKDKRIKKEHQQMEMEMEVGNEGIWQWNSDPLINQIVFKEMLEDEQQQSLGLNFEKNLI